MFEEEVDVAFRLCAVCGLPDPKASQSDCGEPFTVRTVTLDALTKDLEIEASRCLSLSVRWCACVFMCVCACACAFVFVWFMFVCVCVWACVSYVCVCFFVCCCNVFTRDCSCVPACA